MKKQGRSILVALAAVLMLACVNVLVSRQRANGKADAIMKPTFEEGWFRGKTVPVLWLGGKWQPSWLIQYEMDHPTTFVNFGPQFVISWSGKIIMMSPDDLKERIRKNTEDVEQAATPNGATAPLVRRDVRR